MRFFSDNEKHVERLFIHFEFIKYKKNLKGDVKNSITEKNFEGNGEKTREQNCRHHLHLWLLCFPEVPQGC